MPRRWASQRPAGGCTLRLRRRGVPVAPLHQVPAERAALPAAAPRQRQHLLQRQRLLRVRLLLQVVRLQRPELLAALRAAAGSLPSAPRRQASAAAAPPRLRPQLTIALCQGEQQAAQNLRLQPQHLTDLRTHAREPAAAQSGHHRSRCLGS